MHRGCNARGERARAREYGAALISEARIRKPHIKGGATGLQLVIHYKETGNKGVSNPQWSATLSPRHTETSVMDWSIGPRAPPAFPSLKLSRSTEGLCLVERQLESLLEFYCRRKPGSASIPLHVLAAGGLLRVRGSIPLPQSKPQQLLWINSEKHQLCIGLKSILVSRSSLERGVRFGLWCHHWTLSGFDPSTPPHLLPPTPCTIPTPCLSALAGLLMPTSNMERL